MDITTLRLRAGKTAGVLLLGFAIIAAVVCASVFRLPIFTRLDEMVYDTFMTARGPRPVHPAPVIVDIDEASLAALGQWPWPRYLLADLVEKVTDAGAAAVGLDMLQREPDRSSPALIRDQLAERFGARLDLDALPPELLDNDRHFSAVIAGRPVALGAFAQFGAQGSIPPELPQATGLAEKTPPGAPSPHDTVVRASGLLLPLPCFSDAAPIGIINAGLDADGVIRAVPLLVRAGDKIYANLALRTLMRAMGKSSLRLVSAQDGLAELGVGTLRVPVGRDGTFMPVFRGRHGSYPYYSAADVLSGSISAQELQGRIVFVGSSATGLLDIRATPFDPATPGVEVHATIVDNILNGESMHKPANAQGLQILGIALSGLLAALLFGLLPATAYVPLILLLLGGCLWGSWHLFGQGIFLSPVYVAATVLLTAAGILPARFWREEKGRRQLKRAFSRYVSPEVVSRIAARGGEPFAGEQKEVSIMFTDVRGFTSLSEKLAPAQVVRLLNRYFTPMTACVKEHEGTLDKFIGDALMAFWNAPLDVRDHPRKAVLAALAMHRRLDELRPEFQREFGVEVRMGAGIHTGPAHVGNMGSAELLDYTCIGDSVNLASRLEGMCKRYGAGIVVSADTAAACGESLRFRRLDSIRVKGKTRPVDIFTPLDPECPWSEEVEKTWNEALNVYTRGDFTEAEQRFIFLAKRRPELSIPAGLYLKRCRILLASPPGDWDGVWTFDDK